MQICHIIYWPSLQTLQAFAYKLHSISPSMLWHGFPIVDTWFVYNYCGVSPLEWPMLWRITKNSKHNEGTYKWVNWAPIFFWYKLLPTTSGPWKFPKLRGLKVTYFHFPGTKNIQNWKHELIMQLSFFINNIKNLRQFSEKYFSKNGP